MKEEAKRQQRITELHERLIVINAKQTMLDEVIMKLRERNTELGDLRIQLNNELGRLLGSEDE